MDVPAVSGPIPVHLDIQPRCAACGDMVHERQLVFALYGNVNSSAYLGGTSPFPFPRAHIKINDFRVCRKASCEPRHVAPQTVAVHFMCLVIFESECALSRHEAMDRLWTMGAWRNPWPRAHAILLADDYELSRDALSRMANVYKLPQLTNLPVELLDIIRQYSRGDVFWRAITTLALATQLSAASLEPLRVYPLTDVSRWERGGTLELWEPQLDPPVTDDSSGSFRFTLEEPNSDLGRTGANSGVFRFTLDVAGIRSVERLPERPPYCPDRAESTAYIVEEVPALRDVKACFKHGLFQLRPPPGFPGLRIWDTPAPPSLSQCVVFSDKKRAWRQFYTAELNSITGITFLYWHGLLVGVHPHRHRNSSAIPTFERLAPIHRRNTTWMYLPVSEQDSIIILGARPVQLGVNILVRKRLTGDIILGTNTAAVAADAWQRREPTTFVYGEPPEACSVPFLGTYCRFMSDPTFLAARNRHRHRLPTPPSASHPSHDFPRVLPRCRIRSMNEFIYCSSAPLRDVVSAEVFYRPVSSPYILSSGSRVPDLRIEGIATTNLVCQGIILRYRNGGSRALGNVRIGMDSSRTFEDPALLVYRYMHAGRGRLRLRVEFTSDASAVLKRDNTTLKYMKKGYEWWSMEGELRFWFNDDESCVVVHRGTRQL